MIETQTSDALYQDYWDRHVARCNGDVRKAVTHLSPEAYRELYMHVFGKLGPPSDFNGRILDYGCGPALLAPVVKELWPDAEYEGADISLEMVNYASREHENTFYKLPEQEPSGPYDFLICHSVFTHIELDDATDLLKKLRRLVPRGTASISIHNKVKNSRSVIEGDIRRKDYCQVCFENMLEDAGFKVCERLDLIQCYLGVE